MSPVIKCIELLHVNDIPIKYENTRIDCSTLEEKYGVDTLEQYEFEEVIKSFNKFVEHESWKTIDVDDGLEYKKYTPQGNKNWFIGRKYSGKTIMKLDVVLKCDVLVTEKMTSSKF